MTTALPNICSTRHSDEGYEICEKQTGMTHPMILALCESQALVLRPGIVYIFEVVEGCKRCEEINALTQ